MTKTQRIPAAAFVAALLLSGCGGGSSAGSAVPPADTLQTQSLTQSTTGFVGLDALGTPAKSIGELNAEVSNPAALGVCNNGTKFFAPDINGAPNSTEMQLFYDAACTQLARDVVRLYTPIGASAETLSRTMKLYPSGSNHSSVVRTDSILILNAQFDAYGFPIQSAGYTRSETGELDIAGVKTIVSDDEIVVSPSNNNVNSYCGDSAGYNATGIALLNSTGGWNSVLSNATRTLNNDGSVTYGTTHNGTTFKGAIGSLSVAIGAQNTACPIGTPMFTLSGGTQVSTRTIPVVVTYLHNIIQNLSITNGQLGNGNTLNVSTNTNLLPANPQYITGTITNSSAATIATIAVDAFGDGTYTKVPGGQVSTITDWHIIH